MAEGKEFVDSEGRRWRVEYTEAAVRGLVTMQQIVFQALDPQLRGEERYLTVHPGYLEAAGEHELNVALSQAQTVSPPW